MTPSTFPLTFEWTGSEGRWGARCPEWEIECRGLSKETTKKMLCNILCDYDRGILYSKYDESEEKREAAKNVLDNKEMLSELLRENS